MYDFIDKNPRKYRLIYSDQKQIRGCLSWGWKGHEGHKDILRVMDNLDGGDTFTDVGLCQN